MSQIAYQEAFDPYHAVFRMLRIGTLNTDQRILPIDHIRVMDFYLLFPFRIQEFRFKKPHQRFRRMSRDYENVRPYGEWPNDSSLLMQMQPIQLAALSTLARTEIVRASALEHGEVEFKKTEFPDVLDERIKFLKDENQALIEFLQVLINEYETTGVDGIKARSKLLEHRYDAAA